MARAVFTDQVVRTCLAAGVTVHPVRCDIRAIRVGPGSTGQFVFIFTHALTVLAFLAYRTVVPAFPAVVIVTQGGNACCGRVFTTGDFTRFCTHALTIAALQTITACMVTRPTVHLVFHYVNTLRF